MTESIRREYPHPISKISSLSTPETFLNNSNYKNPANQQKIQENISKATKRFASNNQNDCQISGSAKGLTCTLKITENFVEAVLDDSPSSIHDTCESDSRKNYPFTEGLYTRINEYLDEHNFYAVEDPAVFSQSSLFNKKLSFLKFQTSLQSSQNCLNGLTIQSPRSKVITTKLPIPVSNFGELALGNIKGSSLIQRRSMKANSCPQNNILIQKNSKLGQPPLEIISPKLITINDIGSNSFPSLHIKNRYLAAENYENIITPDSLN